MLELKMGSKRFQTYDLRGGLDEISEPVFLDHTHLNEIGDEIIAIHLFEIIMNKSLEK